MIKLRTTIKKDGTQVNWFRNSQGQRVRTRAADQDWTKARDMAKLGLYGIQLQREQALAGIGSDGSQMPPLGKGYAIQKTKLGLGNKRNLYGTGKDQGHMLDGMRINYVDDQKATYAITTRKGQDKAKWNEQKAQWWGLSPDNALKMSAQMLATFGGSVSDALLAMGLAGAAAVASAKRLFRKVA